MVKEGDTIEIIYPIRKNVNLFLYIDICMCKIIISIYLFTVRKHTVAS